MTQRGFLAWCLGMAIAAVSAAGCPGCATVRPPYDHKGEPDPRKQEYVIGPADTLRVDVRGNTDLSGEAIVRPDGIMSLSLVGDVRAAGRTSGQVRAEIAQRLRAFLKEEPVVTVSVTGINSYRFVLSGAIEKPGVYSSNRYVYLTEAVALGGGPNKFAQPEEMILIRNDTRGIRRIPIDYPSILNGTHPEQDLTLLPGDTIYIP